MGSKLATYIVAKFKIKKSFNSFIKAFHFYTSMILVIIATQYF